MGEQYRASTENKNSQCLSFVGIREGLNRAKVGSSPKDEKHSGSKYYHYLTKNYVKLNLGYGLI